MSFHLASMLTPRHRSSLLWGAVGALSFLVLHQTWLLLGGTFTSVGIVATMTALVGVVSTVTTYYAEEWLYGE